ncbi:MAG: prepilin-type N-terminal cleavage/methylation domain-containing protein [Lachnospiraceae bacterium]|nr:prepilin-type N-terminal cleavage/methylation domain-containing protein [Lachnospiraceae bacterium]
MNRSVKGFTLIEVIIAIAILSVVMLTGFRFMTTVANQYGKDNIDIKLQKEVDEIIVLLEDIIIDADSVVIAEDGSSIDVYIVENGNSYMYEVYLSDNSMYYQKYQVTEDGNAPVRDAVYLGTYLKNVEFSTPSEGSVKVVMDFNYNTDDYTATRVITLRNMVASVNSGMSGSSSNTTDETTASGQQSTTVASNAPDTSVTITKKGRSYTYYSVSSIKVRSSNGVSLKGYTVKLTFKVKPNQFSGNYLTMNTSVGLDKIFHNRSRFISDFDISVGTYGRVNGGGNNYYYIPVTIDIYKNSTELNITEDNNCLGEYLYIYPVDNDEDITVTYEILDSNGQVVDSGTATIN